MYAKIVIFRVTRPAEEIFWRVHVPSLNPMLILAAMVCGIAWGGLYRLFPKQLPAILVSHALWDAAAFVWWPL
jgi:hypothetical protein